LSNGLEVSFCEPKIYWKRDMKCLKRFTLCVAFSELFQIPSLNRISISYSVSKF